MQIPHMAYYSEFMSDQEKYAQKLQAQVFARRMAGAFTSGKVKNKEDATIRSYAPSRQRATRQHGVPNGDRKGPKTPHHPGRNEPCPCGSGKKFKVCCGDGVLPDGMTHG